MKMTKMVPICLCLFLLLQNFASASVEKNGSKIDLLEDKLLELIQIVKRLTNENELMQKEIDSLKHQRGVEDDIEQIKLVLESYGQDLTSLRINQGYLMETVFNHDNELVKINTRLDTNGGQLASHDQALAEHQTSIDSNKLTIESHTQILNDYDSRIQWNSDSINANSARIQENQNGIVKNSQDIQSVTDNYNNFRNSQVKFLVDTPCCEGYDKWPDSSRLTFRNKYLDTHNALTDSQFVAPISGFYTFIFTADFKIYDERSEFAYLNVNVNENLVKSFLFDSHHDDEIYQTFSISFTLILNQGDRVDLTTAGDPSFDISRNPGVLLGYLLI